MPRECHDVCDLAVQGHELEAQVAESKLHSDRLAALEAELADTRAAEADARQRNEAHLADLTPLRNKHQHHRVPFSFVYT